MEPLKIMILSLPVYRSQRVLAVTLRDLIEETGNLATVSYRIKAIRRLFKHNQVSHHWLLWFIFKALYYIGDRIFFMKVKRMDAIIISECTPNGFYRDYYNTERFKSILGNIPLIYYSVQYLENSPTLVEKLKTSKQYTIERYDWHLSVASVTEIRGIPGNPWHQIGLNLKSAGLKAQKKNEFMAVIDFIRPGYEHFREIQIEALEESNIPYVFLEGEYTSDEIRKIYKKAALYFIQCPEAFGVPIAECLACGSYVLTPDSSWPMAWRLDEYLEIYGPGRLPDCFVVYDGLEDLKKRLKKLKEDYDLYNTPKEVFNTFYEYYPSYYEGNIDTLNDFLQRIEHKELR